LLLFFKKEGLAFPSFLLTSILMDDHPKTTKPDMTPPQKPREIGGPKGPEPTRYGDWEVKGRCTDF